MLAPDRDARAQFSETAICDTRLAAFRHKMNGHLKRPHSILAACRKQQRNPGITVRQLAPASRMDAVFQQFDGILIGTVVCRVVISPPNGMMDSSIPWGGRRLFSACDSIIMSTDLCLLTVLLCLLTYTF